MQLAMYVDVQKILWEFLSKDDLKYKTINLS